MKREHKKVNMCGMNHPGQVESMLSDMAAKGWQLDEIDNNYYLFRKADPAQMEYRLVYAKDGLSEKQVDRYKETGWENVIWDGKLRVLCAKASYVPSERYFTEQEEAAWKKKGIKSAILKAVVAAVLFFVVGMGVIQTGYGWRLNWRVLMRYGSIKIALAIFGISCLYEAMEPLRIRTYLKKVKEQKQAAHHVEWRRRFYLLRTALVGIPIILFLLSNHPLDLLKSSSDSVELPFIWAEEVIPKTKDEVYTEYDDDTMLFGAKRYTYGQYKETDEEFSFLEQEYYHRATEIDMDAFVESLLLDEDTEEELKVTYNKSNMKRLSVEGLDYAYYVPEQDKEGYAVAVSKGKKVLYMQAHGEFNSEKLIKLLPGKLM